MCVPDGGWRHHPKHVERFTEINELCNAAFCWIYIRIFVSKIENGVLKEIFGSKGCGGADNGEMERTT